MTHEVDENMKNHMETRCVCGLEGQSLYRISGLLNKSL